jgi:hypothetical protein
MWIIVILVLLTVVLALVPGIGLIAILPAALLVAYGVWLLAVFLSGRTPATALRETRRERPLGPGGPDDPDRDRR